MLTLWNDAPLLDSFDRIFDDAMRSTFGTTGAALTSRSIRIGGGKEARQRDE